MNQFGGTRTDQKLRFYEWQQLIEDGYGRTHMTLAPALKEKLSTATDAAEQTALRIEIACFEFSVGKGDLIPLLERVADDGARYAYPDFQSFTEEEWVYIDARLDDATKPFPRARYAHILWLRKKHTKYATLAIAAYRELCTEAIEFAMNGGELPYLFCAYAEAYHKITVFTKVAHDECQSDLLTWALDTSIPIWAKDDVLKVITSSPLFKRADLDGLTQKAFAVAMVADNGYTHTRDFLDALISLGRKEGADLTPIFMAMAENEMRLASDRSDDSTGMISLHAYQRAAHYYKEAKADSEAERAAKYHMEQKQHLKLGLVTFEDSSEELQQWNALLNRHVDHLLEEAARPHFFLMGNEDMLLPAEETDEQVRDSMKGSIMAFVSLSNFDINNNGKTLTEAEKVAHHKWRNYSFAVQLKTVFLLDKLFSKGIREGILTREGMLGFFNSTWLAAGLKKHTNDGGVVPYSWMELMGPGLAELFKQLEIAYTEDHQEPNFVLAIDSLSLKLEGAMRDLVNLAGVPTTIVSERETTAMNLDQMLSSASVKACFQANDLSLWKAVLTRRQWNLRNDVAHAFLRPSGYTKEKALLVLLCIYRFAKYQLVEKSREGDQEALNTD